MNPTDWLNEVWRSELPSNSKLIAAYLRWFLHGQSITCWPSKIRMVADTGLTKRTIKKHLEVLEKQNWLIIDRSKGGRNNRYTIQQVLNVTGDKLHPKQVQNSTLNRGKITPLKNKEKTNKNYIHKMNAMDRLKDRSWAEGLTND